MPELDKSLEIEYEKGANEADKEAKTHVAPVTTATLPASEPFAAAGMSFGASLI